MKVCTRETQAALTPRRALELLEAGNARFLAKRRVERDLLDQVRITAKGQYPFAVVLGCIDSRAPAELVFDQGLGDIFSIRIAGNVLNEDILGSMEFGCRLAGAKLIVVLGHSACGAVRGACEGAKLGHLSGLLDKIRPAIARVERDGGLDGGLNGDAFLQRVAERNVERVVHEIRARSGVLDALIAGGRVGIVGGMYSVQTGRVAFGEMP